MKQTIFGLIPSKSNSYRFDPQGRMYKSAPMRKYENDFFIQCNHYRNKMIDGYFELYLDVYYPNQRSDLDGALKATLDCLQRCKAIVNDNKAVKIVVNKYLDKLNPRIEFEIRTS